MRVGAAAWVLACAAVGCGRVGYDRGSVTGDDGGVSDDGDVADDGGIGAWSFQRKLTFDNPTPEALMGFPVLVVLDGTRIDYSATQPLGQDVRFTDPDGTLLPHEIERFASSGQSYIWVRVPQIDASSSTDFITMHYGNPTVDDGQQPTAVWASEYVGVWHLADDPLGPIRDSTGRNDGAALGNQGPSDEVVGQVGMALNFDGIDDVVVIDGSDPIFDFGTGDFTISVWLRRTAVGPSYMGVFGRYENGAHIAIESAGGNGSTEHDFWLKCSVAEGEAYVDGLVDGQWHWVLGVKRGGTGAIYSDGTFLDSTGGYNCSFDSDDPFRFGYNIDTDAYLAAQLDEGRLTNVPRSADWIRAQYLSMTDAFITYGPELATP